MTHREPHADPAAAAATRPAPEPSWREDALGVRLLHTADVLFARIYHTTIVRSRCLLPPSGPAILVSNHTSGIDPLLIQSTTRRVIVWMMAKEYYDIRAMNWAFRAIHAIPVERSGRDMAATRAALRALADGHVLGVFPEGKIATTRGQLLPFQPGVALLAMKAKVPVYPTFLDGTQYGKEMLPAFLERQRATLRFGQPVDFDRRSTSRESLDAATGQIRNAVAALSHERTETD